jgi:hypothetical protein
MRIFTATVLYFIFFNLSSAQAGIFKHCWQLVLNTNAQSSQLIKPELPEEYQIYLKTKQSSAPPARTADSETPLADLILSPDFWWYPGNVYYSDFEVFYSKEAQQIEVSCSLGLPDIFSPEFLQARSQILGLRHSTIQAQRAISSVRVSSGYEDVSQTATSGTSVEALSEHHASPVATFFKNGL